jgi:hypothetical protein
MQVGDGLLSIILLKYRDESTGSRYCAGLELSTFVKVRNITDVGGGSASHLLVRYGGTKGGSIAARSNMKDDRTEISARHQ